MTKKKRSHPSIEEVLARPWCYYCERDFDDLKVLLSHQKAKHFKCERCGRRLNTAGGLSVHMTQVHKESLESVENALPNRASLNIEIFGMEGIPEEILQQHNQRVIAQWHQEQADRHAATGNSNASGDGGNAAKKPKLEATSDLKARLAAFKAKKANNEPTGPSSGNGTPMSTGPGASSPPSAQSPIPYASQQGFAPPQYATQSSPMEFQQPPGQLGYGLPPQPPFPVPSQFQAPTSFNNPQFPPGMPQVLHGQPGMSFQQPHPTGAPPTPSNLTQMHQVPSSMPNGLPKPSGLAPAPGLPSRPTFGAPAVNAQQLHQMHQGQYQAPNVQSYERKQDVQSSKASSTIVQEPRVSEADIDNLVTAAPKSAEASNSEVPKKQKKEDKPTRLVYDDNEVSPEEKMAKFAKYAFDPTGQPPETVLGRPADVTYGEVTGPVVSEDDVLDKQGD